MLDAEEFSPGDVMATPLPPMPKANQLEAKRARLARWQRDPSVIEKEIAEQKDAVTRAEEKDALVSACVRACSGCMSLLISSTSSVVLLKSLDGARLRWVFWKVRWKCDPSEITAGLREG